jgi:ATP-dependent helicase/DNAse subunit B
MKLSVLNEAARLTPIKGLGLSLSKIKLFETCAYRYYLQYFAKETFDKEDYNPKFFKIGQFAHKYIESKIKGIECKFNSETLTDVDKQFYFRKRKT